MLLVDRRIRLGSLLICALALLFIVLPAEDSVFAQQTESPELLFEQDIRPILRAHCLDCHGATDEKEGGLDLRQVRRMLAGGDSGAAIEAGDSQASYLMQRIRAEEMPPGPAKVPDHEVEILERWIEQGAKTARPEPEDIPDGIGLTPEERSFWFFQPLSSPQPPAIDDLRIRNDVDRFVLARLRERGLDFSPEADRRVLAQRLYFDLLGLPPTREELETFVNDPDPLAYEKLVDRLLESPHYGERWGRHWLDVAGYADSEGFTNADQPREWAYAYRDYVIKAFNDDKPIDRFILEQLAGDELVPPPHNNLTPDQIEILSATGFLRMAADGTGQGGVDEPLARNQTIADTLKIVSTSLMGLSLACAQCHDHRYDPILQEDYYRLRAVFTPALDWQDWKTPSQRRVSLYTDADREKAAEVEAQAQQVIQEKNAKQAVYLAEALAQELEKYEEPLRSQLKEAYETPQDKRSEEQSALLLKNPSVNITPGVLYQYNQAAADDLKTYDQRIAEIRNTKPAEKFLRTLTEPAGSTAETQIFHRGDHRQPTKTVAPGELTVLFASGERQDLPLDNPNLATTGRRTALAQALTSGRHSLFNRVFVNRVWMHHFGRGIVGTPSDFGQLGDRPTHPHLLDWLACQLPDNGWSLKSLHRQLLTSHTYRQQSEFVATAAEIDQDNQWLWRYPVRRLEAEIIRDRILAASGAMDLKQFGPPIALQEDDTGQVIPVDDSRRSVYLQVRRSQPVAILQAFDAPIMETNCDRRIASTVAPQSLMLLNSSFLRTQAERMAQRLADEADGAIADAHAPAASSQLNPLVSPWRYGYGLEQESGIFDFRPLPFWTGSSWQGGDALPDSNLGWCLLHAQGGHPDQQLAVIRSWQAYESDVLRISGQLSHGSDQGNGVRGRIYSSRLGQLGEFRSHHNEVATEVETVDVEAGDEIWFVVDSLGDQGFDSFRWPVTLVSTTASDTSWDSTKGFGGPQGAPIEKQVVYAWWLAYQRAPDTQEYERVLEWLAHQVEIDPHAENQSAALQQAMVSLCQSLLGSNEFLYVE